MTKNNTYNYRRLDFGDVHSILIFNHEVDTDFWECYKLVHERILYNNHIALRRQAIDKLGRSVSTEFEDEIFCLIKDKYYGEL